MNRLEYGLFLLCERNRDGSYATQANRRKMLALMTEQLRRLGYRVYDPITNKVHIARDKIQLPKNPKRDCQKQIWRCH